MRCCNSGIIKNFIWLLRREIRFHSAQLQWAVTVTMHCQATVQTSIWAGGSVFYWYMPADLATCTIHCIYRLFMILFLSYRSSHWTCNQEEATSLVMQKSHWLCGPQQLIARVFETITRIGAASLPPCCHWNIVRYSESIAKRNLLEESDR